MVREQTQRVRSPLTDLQNKLLPRPQRLCPRRLFTEEEVQKIRRTTFRHVLVAVTSAEAADLQEKVFFWEDGTQTFLYSRHQQKVQNEMVKDAVASGDPCPQPTQLRESMLHACAKATKLSYFDGSKAGFTLFILVLFLFPAGERLPLAFSLEPSP